MSPWTIIGWGLLAIIVFEQLRKCFAEKCPSCRHPLSQITNRNGVRFRICENCNWSE